MPGMTVIFGSDTLSLNTSFILRITCLCSIVRAFSFPFDVGAFPLGPVPLTEAPGSFKVLAVLEMGPGPLELVA